MPISSVLHEARQAHVAVSASSGPHAAPVLFGVAGERLGFLTATPTLIARSLSNGDRAGALVRSGPRAIVGSGEVQVIDPFRPRSLAAAVTRAPTAAQLVASFGLRNVPDLLGFVRDAAQGRVGKLPPPRRVLIVFETAEWIVTDEAGDADVVLAAHGELGPVALPARWEPEGERVHVPETLLKEVGLHDGRVAVVADEYGRPGPAAKQGLILRGEGTVRRGAVDIEPDRVSEWDGVETASTKVD